MGTTVDAHGVSLTTSLADAQHAGFKISTNLACTLTTITKHSSCTATTAELLNSGKGVLATASFSGNNATFSYDLASGTTYYVTAYGGTYTQRRKNASGYPYSGTNVNFTGGIRNTDTSIYQYNIVSVTTDTTITKELSDSFTVSDSHTYEIQKIIELNETFTVSGSLGKDITKTFTEGVIIDDTVDVPLLAQGTSIAYNDGIISTAKINITYTGSAPTIWLSADGGSNWEEVTNNTLHNFTNTGNDLRWRVRGVGTVITKIVVDNY